ncbi:hypothetical protein D3C78_1217100 [compost metagenome]
MSIQFRGLEQFETGKTQVALELRGVDAGVLVVEQGGTEMHFSRQAGFRVNAVHAYRLLEAHADVEELHVQLPVQLIPQRVVGVVLDGIEILRCHGRQSRWQHLFGVLVTAAGQLLGLRFQRLEIEGLRLAIGRPGPGASGQQTGSREASVGCDGHGGLEQIPAVHRTTFLGDPAAFLAALRIRNRGSDKPSAKRVGF